MEAISAKEVLEILRAGNSVIDVVVSEPIDLRQIGGGSDGASVVVPVEFSGCQLHSLDGVMLQFHRPLIMTDTTVGVSGDTFAFSYFLEGLTMERCRFHGDLSFECGGHNQNNFPIILHDCTFGGLVNFFDCWFEAPVEIRGCRFEKGTNLLGNNDQPYEVAFDFPPVIENNLGQLDLYVRQ